MNDSIQIAITKFGTQEGLAKAIGVSQAVVSHYLTGYRVPSKKVAEKLESAVDNEIPWHKFMEVSTSPQIDLLKNNQSKPVDNAA